MASPRFWTPEKLALLQALWCNEKQRSTVLSGFPGLTWLALQNAAYRRGFFRPVGHERAPRKWPADRRARFVHLWATCPDAATLKAEFPDQTASSLRVFAAKNGIKRLSGPVSLPAPTESPMTEAERAWLAGFIDGEGNISVHPQYSRGTIRHLSPRLAVANTYRPALQQVMEMTKAGSIVVVSRKHPNWKIVYAWISNRRESIRSILVAVLPYLRVKAAQARLVIAFIELRLVSQCKDTCSSVADQMAIYHELKTLNQRGPVSPEIKSAL